MSVARAAPAMRALLAPQQAELLAQLAWTHTLLAFDFDGTLAPITEAHTAAQMRPRTVELLREVCKSFSCAVISGRGREDVTQRLGGAAVKYVIGNHGLEPGGRLAELEQEVAAARPPLAAALAAHPCIELEDKRYSLALHYRRCRRKGEAKRAIAAAVAALPREMRLVPGKQVVNTIPADAPNKGDALLALRDAEGAALALYVGDDVTDEDVFRLEQPGRLLGVRVGSSRHSAASYYLRDQREIDRLLTKLIALRANIEER